MGPSPSLRGAPTNGHGVMQICCGAEPNWPPATKKRDGFLKAKAKKLTHYPPPHSLTECMKLSQRQVISCNIRETHSSCWTSIWLYPRSPSGSKSFRYQSSWNHNILPGKKLMDVGLWKYKTGYQPRVNNIFFCKIILPCRKGADRKDLYRRQTIGKTEKMSFDL